MGAFVATTASAGKLDSLRALGADVVIDRASADWGVSDVDVVLDVVGGDYCERNFGVLRTKGTVVQVGTMAGTPPSFNVGLLMMKRATWIGTTLRARPIEEKIALTQRFVREVLPLFDTGALRPIIDSRFALDDAPAAHEHLESNQTIGKVLLTL